MDHSEEFLRRNANKDYISEQFAEVLRDVIRAMASRSQHPANNPVLWRAAETMALVMELSARCPETVTYNDVLTTAVERLSVRFENRHDEFDEAIIAAAIAGMLYLVEMTAMDGAARGRESNRRNQFLHAINEFGKARERARLARWDPAHTWDAVQVAAYLGKSEGWFLRRRAELEAEGFPPYDERSKGWDANAIKAWLDQQSGIATR